MRNIIITLLLLVACSLPASAQMQKAYAGVQGKVTSTVKPQGTLLWYSMNAYLESGSGTVMYYGLSNQLCFGMDGNTVYFKTLFPSQYDELWVKGRIEGNRVIIDSKEVIGTESFNTDEGRLTYELKVGEPIFDIMDNLVGVRDVEFIKDGSRIYIDDDQKNPDHPIALYGEDEYGIQLFDWTFCDDFNPYNGPTDVTQVPDGATVSSFIYDYDDSYLKPSTNIGHVATDGADYYFDNLIPDVPGWVKGTRSGNQVTISKGQLIAFKPLILRVGGYLQSDGGRLSDVVFNVNSDGSLTQQNPDQFMVAYQTNGSLYSYARNFRIKPYDEAKVFTPALPFEVHSVYYSEINQHGIEFYQTNYADDGSKLSPDQLGYYIYVDGKRFTFNKKEYPHLSWDSTDFIPFGYCDDYNMGDIFNDGIYNCVLFYFDSYETLGVQSVYRSGELEKRSDIVTVDRYNVLEIIPDEPTGIQQLKAEQEQSWYDLSGRHIQGGLPQGISIQSGRKIIK